MIWTISSRASPLPPGNWCDALSTVWAWLMAGKVQSAAAAAKMAANFLIGLLCIIEVFLIPQGTQFFEHCQSIGRRSQGWTCGPGRGRDGGRPDVATT